MRKWPGGSGAWRGHVPAKPVRVPVSEDEKYVSPFLFRGSQRSRDPNHGAAKEISGLGIHRDLRKMALSIMMFIVDTNDESDSKFNTPIFTEAVFINSVLPVATRIGADILANFGRGIEFVASDADELVRDLEHALKEIPANDAERQYIVGRIENLISQIRLVFEEKPDVTIFIG
jgi:hypothetical protein